MGRFTHDWGRGIAIGALDFLDPARGGQHARVYPCAARARVGARPLCVHCLLVVQHILFSEISAVQL